MSKPFAIPSIHLGHILLTFSLLQKQLLYFLLFSLYFYGVISMYTFLFAMLYNNWDRVFKNGPSQIFGRQSLKKFTWSVLEYFDSMVLCLGYLLKSK